MDSLPLEVVYIINKWVIEFNRVDAMERYALHTSLYANIMGAVCEDVRLNVPYYTFYMYCPGEKHLAISIFIPDCNPRAIDPDIFDIRRRSVSVPHTTSDFISDI